MYHYKVAHIADIHIKNKYIEFTNLFESLHQLYGEALSKDSQSQEKVFLNSFIYLIKLVKLF